MIQRKLKGMGVALVTPFNEDGSVDYNALVRLVEYQVQNGTDFLCVLGTTAAALRKLFQYRNINCRREEADKEGGDRTCKRSCAHPVGSEQQLYTDRCRYLEERRYEGSGCRIGGCSLLQ